MNHPHQSGILDSPWDIIRCLKLRTKCASRQVLSRQVLEVTRPNHSLRVSNAMRLYSSGVDEQLIMECTGHRSVDGVRSYTFCYLLLASDQRNDLQHEKTYQCLLCRSGPVHQRKCVVSQPPLIPKSPNANGTKKKTKPKHTSDYYREQLYLTCSS